MEIRFKIDADRLTLDDLIALEETPTARVMRDTLAKFLTDETGAFVEEAQARKTLGGLAITQLNAAAAQFRAAVEEVQNSAVPPVQSGG